MAKSSKKKPARKGTSLAGSALASTALAAAGTPVIADALLRQLTDTAIAGIGALPGAKQAAARALVRCDDAEAAIDAVIKHHVRLAGAQGLVTNLGGIATLAAALPANIAAATLVQLRMLAAIAHLRGYDVDNPRVRSALRMSLLGDTSLAKRIGRETLPTRPLAVATAPVFDPDLDKTISDQVVAGLLARVGGKHVTSLIAKRVPILGGPVGAAVDSFTTRQLGLFAKREFVSRRPH